METQFIKLNMTPTGINPCFHVSQYDIGRPLGFMIYNGSEVVDLDSYTCTIEATRSDGVAITASVTTDDNIGTFETTATMTNKADKYRAQFVIVDGNSNRIASLPFDIDVCKAAMDENSESIEEDASLYQQYTEAVQGAIAEANADIQAEENARIATVSAEATTRANADATLQTNINAEATARQTADNTLQSNINSEASTRATQDGLLQTQIDQIIAPSGEAPSAAEVQNARIGADGVTYDTLGEAIRTNDNKLKSQLEDIYYTEVVGTNLVDPNATSVGSLNSDGSVNTGATTYLVSDFIPLDANTDYIFTIWKNGVIITSRKYVALYDASKTYIADTYQNVTSRAEALFNSASAKYARVACGSDALQFLCKGTSLPSAFSEYTEKHISKLDYEDDSIPQAAILFTIPFVEKQVINIYDSSTDENGYIDYGGGITGGGESYRTTAYIKTQNGYTYKCAGHVRFIGYYDATKTFVSRDATAVYNPTINADSDGYIRISYYIDNPLTSIETSFAGSATEKLEEGVSLSNYQLNQVDAISEESKKSGNVLYGKKWAVCGDSFTNSGGTGTKIAEGKYAGKDYTYPWLIGNRNNMNIVQFFGGGRTLAFPAEPGAFVNSLTCQTQGFYYQNIPADADYITIYLGINDRNHSTGQSSDGEDTTGVIPLGTVDDDTINTYLGAYNVVLTWLITNRPNAHIGMIVTNGIAAADSYRQGQIAIAEKYGIPYIDMNGDARTPAMLRTSNPNIPASIKQALITKWAVNPGTNEHPNDAAQLFESTFIENFLRSI